MVGQGSYSFIIFILKGCMTSFLGPLIQPSKTSNLPITSLIFKRVFSLAYFELDPPITIQENIKSLLSDWLVLKIFNGGKKLLFFNFSTFEVNFSDKNRKYFIKFCYYCVHCCKFDNREVYCESFIGLRGKSKCIVIAMLLNKFFSSMQQNQE